jgi:DNA-directed RNA polymerase specialized sigma subunit
MSVLKKTQEIADAMEDWRSHGKTGDTRIDVHRALEKLPAPNRKIIILRAFEEMTWEECAEAMSYGRTRKLTPAAARTLYRDSAIAMKKILAGSPKAVPLVRARLDKKNKA